MTLLTIFGWPVLFVGLGAAVVAVFVSNRANRPHETTRERELAALRPALRLNP